MTFDPKKLKQIVEGALLAAGKPLSVAKLAELFEESAPRPGRDEIQAALEDLGNESAGRGFEVIEVASGYRVQVKEELAPWVSRLWEEKPQRYSRALLETLALVAYRQPITRGEIEDIRGVAVSTNIIRTLLDRDWVRVVGHREVPGRPAMYATTKSFLDYFNLKHLDELPSLAAIRDLDSINAELDFAVPLAPGAPGEGEHPEQAPEQLTVPIDDTAETSDLADNSGEQQAMSIDEVSTGLHAQEDEQVGAEPATTGEAAADERALPNNVFEMGKS
jgi:segregation and condensation protein B